MFKEYMEKVKMNLSLFRKEKKNSLRGGFLSYTKMLLDPTEAEKEALLINWLYENNISVPKLFDRHKGIVTFDFINGKNLSELLDSGNCKKEELFEKVIETIAPIYEKNIPNKIRKILSKKGLSDNYKRQGDRITEIFDMDLWNEGDEYLNNLKKLQKNAHYFVFDDLNPDNLKINENGRVYVFDTGSSMLGVPQTDLARLLLSFNYEGNKDAEQFALDTLKKYCKLNILNSQEIYCLSKLHVFLKMAAGCELMKKKNKENDAIYEGTKKHLLECAYKSLK